MNGLLKTTTPLLFLFENSIKGICLFSLEEKATKQKNSRSQGGLGCKSRNTSSATKSTFFFFVFFCEKTGEGDKEVLISCCLSKLSKLPLCCPGQI